METTKKLSMATVIREFFKMDGESLPDYMLHYKQLTEKDKLELASAIAVQKGYTQEQCAFGFIQY